MVYEKIRIVMLCGDNKYSRMMYNGLTPFVDVKCVILEENTSKICFIKKRFKKLGFLKTTGQLLFIIINKLIEKLSRSRVNKLINGYGLINTSFPKSIIQKVENINSKKTINLLKNINPDAVVINGTRIISNKILSAFEIPFINTHMGITPKYRGVHGAYWALVNGDPDNCGVTIHLVDKGIDTGGILYQDIINIEKYDNLNTYPIHQMAKALPLMKTALNDIKEKRINIKNGAHPSRLWYHPTLFEYVKNWVLKGVV